MVVFITLVRSPSPARAFISSSYFPTADLRSDSEVRKPTSFPDRSDIVGRARNNKVGASDNRSDRTRNTGCNARVECSESHWSIEVNTCDKSLGAQHHQPTSLGRSCCPNYAQVESVGSQTARLNRSTLSICLSPEHVPLYFQMSFSLRLVPHSRQYGRKMTSLQAYLPPARPEVQRSRKFRVDRRCDVQG